jgi:hypothetical protein
VRSLTITTANDAVERDPASYQLFGTNDPITSAAHSTGTNENWTLISSGLLSLPAGRNTVGETYTFLNDTHYNSFRLIFPTVKNAVTANSMQIAEVQLGAVDIGTAPAPIPDVTTPGDFIIPIDLDAGPGNLSSSPGAEQAPLAIDNKIGTKYLNFGDPNSGSNSELNTGFIVTPSNNPAGYAVTSLTITTANDAQERDPASFELYGTNDPITSTAHGPGNSEMWTLIASGALNLPAARNTVGPTVNFVNTTHYSSFRLVFPTVKNVGAANSMQIAEVQLGATAIPAVPEPASAMLGALALGAMALRRRRAA